MKNSKKRDFSKLYFPVIILVFCLVFIVLRFAGGVLSSKFMSGPGILRAWVLLERYIFMNDSADSVEVSILAKVRYEDGKEIVRLLAPVVFAPNERRVGGYYPLCYIVKNLSSNTTNVYDAISFNPDMGSFETRLSQIISDSRDCDYDVSSFPVGQDVEVE
jgi:hypothetical protein